MANRTEFIVPCGSNHKTAFMEQVIMANQIVLPTHSQFKNLTGSTFGRLTVVAFAGTNNHNKSMWSCQCQCGKAVVCIGSGMSSGHTRSCGCLSRDIGRAQAGIPKAHGRSYSREYRAWADMKRRCNDASRHEYNNYGGRGIVVAAEWLHFPTFFRDMGPCPSGMTLDRINNNGNYESGNCRWVTTAVQNRNKRTNHLLTIDGTTRTIAEWSEVSGVKRATICARLRRGWSADRAVLKVGPSQ